MSYAIRAGFALTAIAAVVVPATAQSNPYRQVEAPEPPPDMNVGEWGELCGVDLDPQGNVWVLHRCFKAVLGDPRVSPGHSDGINANCLGPWVALDSSGYPPQYGHEIWTLIPSGSRTDTLSLPTRRSLSSPASRIAVAARSGSKSSTPTQK